MASVKKNIIANYAGSFWSALMGLAFVPLYIKFMGIEAYGLVGFFGTIIALFGVLDLGLAATLNREMARRSVLPGEQQNCRDLLRTLEIIYWGIAVVIGTAVALLSQPIATYWINPERLTPSEVQQAVTIMGLVIVLRWPFGLYQGGLMGLQRQVIINGLNATMATVRGLGAVGVLWFISPTIQAFFIFQILVSGIETIASAFLLWRALGPGKRGARFHQSMLSEVWSFAVGMMGINVVAMILMQTDKIILSKMLSLQMYGYYMLAWTVAGALNRLMGPVFIAIFPRFSQLVATGDDNDLVALYHKSCQFLSVMIWPVAIILALYSYEVLLLWTGDAEIANKTYRVLSLLVLGTACNAMMNVPYALQLAYGWTSLAYWMNVVSIIVLIPMLVVLTNHYGMIGGAIVWISLNIGYVLIALSIMHGNILKGELQRWYIGDVGTILAGTVATVLLGRLFEPERLTPLPLILFLGGLTAFASIGAVLTSMHMRTLFFFRVAGLVSLVQNRLFQPSR